MDKTVVDFHREGKMLECTGFLRKSTQEELKKCIDSRFLKSRGDPGEFIRSIMYGSPSNSKEGQERRLFVFRHCVALLQTNELSAKLASELVGILLLETDELSAPNLAELSSLFVDSIKSGAGRCGKSLELFPKILSSLATRPVVSFGNQEMTGETFKSHVLNNLNSGRWDTGSVIHLAAMFKDVPLSSDELGFVLEKLIRAFNELDLQELPPLVYQMLLLSNKGHKRLVLEGVTAFFCGKDDTLLCTSENDDEELSEAMDSSSQLPHIEGTVILHVTYAIKQDPDLGREFLKFLKSQYQASPVSVLAPFNVALALSVARIHRFEDQIMDLLKAAILQSFKDGDRRNSSQWIRDTVPETKDTTSLLVRTVKNSVHGWDHVSQGLVDLGFVLMDSFGPRSTFGKIQSDINPSCHFTPMQKACQLGATILNEIFKGQEVVRAGILEQILNRVVTKATVPVSHYLDLLANTVKSAPQILLESLPKVREAFDYLSFLPPPTAVGFMKAILPLMKISVGLKDGLMLTLRKALFSRQLESRKIATSGFLLLMSKFKVIGGLPSSQSSQSFSASQLSDIDVHTTFNSKMSEAVCIEILGSLRRCLSQQADVRMTLYEGILEVLCQNTSLGLPIIQLLQTQLTTYYEDKQDIQPPVKLEPCIIAQNDQVYLGEPLAHLLCTLIQCLIKTKEIGSTENDSEGKHDEVITEIEGILESLYRRLMKSELEDFELDRAADFTSSTSVGIKNTIFAILTMGCYEGLIEYSFLTSDFEPSSIQNLLQLQGTYQRLSELIKEKSHGGGAGKRRRQSGGAGSAKLGTQSMLSLKVVDQLLDALYCDSTPSHQEAIELLRNKPEFGRYIMNVGLQKLTHINDKGWCEGPHGQDPAKIFQHCASIAKTLNKYYTDNVRQFEASKEKMKIASWCLEGLALIIHLICDRYSHRIPEFLQMLDEDSDIEEEDLIHEHIKRFQRLAVSNLSNDDHCPKEALHIFNIISYLSQNLTSGQSQLNQVQSWVQKLTAEQSIDDSVVAKALMSLFISLCVRQQNIAPLLREMAQDIHRVLGDIDQEVEVTSESHFVIVTPRTAAPTILLLILGQIDHELDDTEWVISRQLAQLTATRSSDHTQQKETQREDVEKGICTRLGHFVNVFHELGQSAIPVGPCVDNLIKTVTRLYKSLTLLVKYYLNVYSKRTGQMSTRFEKLVRLSGSNLTPRAYAMITYIQATQSEHLQQTTEKKKKKDQKLSSLVAAASKAKVLKETRQIPNLIFAIEEYENFLIQLSKKSKVNLMEHMKLSTSRDFRINLAQVTTALEEEDSSSGSEADSDSDNNTRDGGGSDQIASDNESDNREPPPKKSKMGTKGKSVATKAKGKFQG